jgi:heme-degrading monooxygenase HmoA
MILEVATLDVKPGQRDQFQAAFKQAAPIIAGMKGYIAHQLQECVENRQRFLLLVWWQTLEDHTVGFRGSAEYQRWRALLHHFYDPFPTVEHFSLLSGNGTIPQR